jgi:hypothetical protein
VRQTRSHPWRICPQCYAAFWATLTEKREAIEALRGVHEARLDAWADGGSEAARH